MRQKEKEEILREWKEHVERENPESSLSMCSMYIVHLIQRTTDYVHFIYTEPT